jgi:hypothetical protein
VEKHSKMLYRASLASRHELYTCSCKNERSLAPLHSDVEEFTASAGRQEGGLEQR